LNWIKQNPIPNLNEIINAKAIDGRTPLDTAIYCNNVQTVSMIYAAGGRQQDQT